MNHDHRHAGPGSHRYLKPLVTALILIGLVMVAEAIAGWVTGSLALVSDAGHMATDALGLGMAVAAILAARKPGIGGGRTYGLYRAEILAALGNALLLFAVAGYVLYEAVQRLTEPQEVLVLPMAIVAVVGLAVNIVAWRLLRTGAKESLNLEGAYLEVIADLVGSIGVVGGALLIWITGWTQIDSLIGAAIGLFILPRAWRLAAKAVRILLQSAPVGLDLEALATDLRGIHGVLDVHDLHVWTLTSEMDVGTVHLMVGDDVDPHPVLDKARELLVEQGIAHATLQVEPESHHGCSEISW